VDPIYPFSYHQQFTTIPLAIDLDLVALRNPNLLVVVRLHFPILLQLAVRLGLLKYL
jgi:hypothetical protein